MFTRSRQKIATAVSGALACAALLSFASAPLEVRAAQPASHVIARLVGPHGELVRFTMLADGSVGVDAGVAPGAAQNSILGREKFSTPLELFAAVAPAQQPPAELLAANERYVSALQALRPDRPKAAVAAQHGSPRGIMPMNSQAWFINEYCNVSASYNVCFAPAYSWAYLSSSSVYYGYAVTYAINAPLYFSVSPIGAWTVPTGWTWYAWKYNSFHPFGWNEFAFLAQVRNAGYFDFESNVDY
jgi:hypothetical protein